jgi:hypothetical protein
LRGLTTAITAVGAAMVVGHVTWLVALVNQRGLLNDLKDGVDITFSEVDRADNLVALGAGFVLALSIANYVLMIIWLWRAWGNAHRFVNAPHLMPRGRGWAIGAWFIPCATWVLVPMLMADSWRSADPLAPQSSVWRTRPRHAAITVWAALTPLFFVLGRGSISEETADIDAYLSQNRMDMFGAIVGLAWVTATIWMIRAIAARHHERAAALGLSDARG